MPTTAIEEEKTQPFSNEVVTSSETGQVASRPYTERLKIDWIPFLFISAMHVGAFFAFFTFSWKALGVCVFLHWLSGGVGITLGFHRLLTHRSFKVPKFLEYFFAVIGSLACQGGPMAWVAAHRLHHAFSDQDKDPHSPKKGGFFWAHMGWCMTQNQMLTVYKKYRKYVPDMDSDPVHVWINRTYILWTVALAGALYALGGWPFVVWGIFVRLILVYHCTWLVNSAAHVWGYKTYDAKDESTNLWWVALLTYGEGWHNNHHAFQYSARHGLKWWEVDTTYWLIKALEFFRLAKAVKLPTDYALQTAKLSKAS